MGVKYRLLKSLYSKKNVTTSINIAEKRVLFIVPAEAP